MYAEEPAKLRFNIADYYLFSKMKYQLPLVYRALVWGALAIFSGIMCFYIPFFIYGYGVAGPNGKTEDLFSVYFAAYQANVMTHHVQMFVTIRNYTSFFGLTAVISISILWPCAILLCHFEWLTSENLYRHYGNLFFEETFYQFSAVFLATIIVILPIYFFKAIKMRLLFPKFFPTDQSTIGE